MKRKYGHEGIYKTLESLVVREANHTCEALCSPVSAAEMKMPDDVSQPRMSTRAHIIPMAKNTDKWSRSLFKMFKYTLP